MADLGHSIFHPGGHRPSLVELEDQEVREWQASLENGTSESSGAATSGIAEGQSPANVLRRLSLTRAESFNDQNLPFNRNVTDPALKLSGRVISAVFCLPFTIKYRKEAEWELNPRRGTSALFDSLAFLSSPESSWDHTVVGWTGEIGVAKNLASTPITPASHGFGGAAAPATWQGRTGRVSPTDGITISRSDRERLEKQLEHDEDGDMVPVWLLDEPSADADMIVLKDQARWRRYAEHELFTLFHYKQGEPSDGQKERLWWADYFRMNNLFADRIMEIYKPGDVIWIHDYHLALLPAILRQRLPDAYISFFLHIPFPSSEFLRCLSRRKEILQGMLGANLIGFQSYGYSRHFISCCKRILRFESTPAGIDAYGAHVAVEVFPIGINAASTKHSAYDDPLVSEKIRGLRELYAGKKIIVGRDRLDTVRGVAQKLQAFEIFLDRYPQWKDKVVLIQVTSPTSVVEEKEDSSNKIANKVSDLVSRINGKNGSLSFSPVQHYSQYLSREEYFALLRIADVGLITSVRDGMNTTSLEYVLCQEGNWGPLILSEFSGTAGSLSNAIHINPWDLYGVAESIDAALSMPLEERKSQHRKLYQHVTTNTIQYWASRFLDRLITTISLNGKSVATPSLDKTALLESFRKSKKRLFMFDYDGTLTPIVKDPQSAIPSDRVIRNLKILSSDARNHVWIISGRDQAFLDEWMGHIPALGFSAEHGSFLRHPEASSWENVTEKTDMTWQEEVMRVMQHFTEKTQGSWIERKKVALTWHYRNADPDHGAYQAGECRELLEQTVGKSYDVEVMAGKANLEVRPRFVNKGEIAKRLIAEYSEGIEDVDGGVAAGKLLVSKGPDFVFCLGDDFTDEDMFRALRASDLAKENVFACTVGASSKKTLASWHLLEPKDVISTIAMLNGATDDSNVGAVALANRSVNGA